MIVFTVGYWIQNELFFKSTRGTLYGLSKGPFFGIMRFEPDITSNVSKLLIIISFACCFDEQL